MTAGPDGKYPGSDARGGSRSYEKVLAGRILRGGRLEPVEIGLGDDGRILRVAKSLPGGHRMDFGDRVILPAATDLHVHFREPGGPEASEDLATGTLQAAIGGVGTVGDMPNNEPPTDSVEALEEKAARARRRLSVDMVLYAGVSRPARIPGLARVAGAFKLYMSPTTGVGDPPARAAFAGLMRSVAETGLPLTVHAEDSEKFRQGIRLKSTADWDAHRPVAAEASAVSALLPAPPGLRLHVAHITETAVADPLRAAGHSFEATPHHLFLSTRSARSSFGKVNPPLRSEANRHALWAAFADGKIPCLASDHAPHSQDEKERDFDLAPSGMPGVETMLPLLLEASRAGEIPLDVLVAAVCERPARWLGLPMGRVAVGHRANLLVVDFRQRTVLSAEHLHAPCHWTAFEGWEGVFPQVHLRDGELLVKDGEFVGRRDGRVVRPEYAPLPTPERFVESSR